MRYARVASRVFNTPLLIEPSRLAPISNYLLGRMQGQAPAEGWTPGEGKDGSAGPAARSQLGASGFDDDCGWLTPDGVAVITITGELVQRPYSIMDPKCDLLSYGEIEARFDAALADSRVRGILLEIDSPGGEAAGCFSLADKMFNARGLKPVWALANEGAASAAYALASTADRVLLPESGHVGSVGVIWQALDQSRLDQAVGLQYAVIQYGARKNDFNPHFPVSKEALAWAQAEVTRLGEQFVAMVARNRRFDPQAVRDTQAGLLFGPAAVEGGLADAILEAAGPGQNLVAKAAGLLAMALNKSISGGAVSPAAARHHNQAEGASLMTKEEKEAAGAAPAEPQANAASAAQLEAARAEGRAAGAVAERARIAAILNHPEAAGREDMARGLALETDMEASAVGGILARAPKAAKAAAAAPHPLAQAMAGIAEPQVLPDGPRPQAQGNKLMGLVMAQRLGLAPGGKKGGI